MRLCINISASDKFFDRIRLEKSKGKVTSKVRELSDALLRSQYEKGTAFTDKPFHYQMVDTD